MKAPIIVVIAYNRANCLKRLLDSIKEANYSHGNIKLIISIDYWKSDNPCYKVADDFVWEHGEKEVIRHKENLGLRKHVLFCGDFSQVYDSVILLEDDISVSEEFYNYAERAVNFYYDKNEVVGIGLYSLPYNGYAQLPFIPYKNGFDTYYGRWVISWGECFCKHQWGEFRKWYGNGSKKLKYCDSIPSQITDWSDSSWGKFLVYYMNEKGLFFANPYEAYSTNHSDEGDHVNRKNNTWQTSMQHGQRELRFADNDSAIKYNTYFERIFEVNFDGTWVNSEEICIDLYGITKGYEKYKYCLSIRHLPYEIIHTYGLKMHPIELNIEKNIEGNEIFLYDMEKKVNRRKSESMKVSNLIYRYYYPMFQLRKGIKFILIEVMNKLKDKLKR